VFQLCPALGDGGAETLVKDYCIVAKTHNIDMKIVTYVVNAHSANERIAQDNGIDVLRIYRKWNLRSRIFHKLFGRLYIPIRLKKIVCDQQPEVIHIHMAMLKYVAPISRFLKERNVGLFYTCHSLPERYFSGKEKSELYACKKLIKNNRLKIISLHNEMREELNCLFGVENTTMIRNGIILKKFLAVGITKEEKRNELGIPVDSFVIGHIGRFDAMKNHSFLIDIFAEIVKKRENAHLLLIGSGELKEKMEEKLKGLGLDGKYTILSNRKDIPELLKAMDVFVFPSLYEGLSITMIEAQASGLPCVVSDRINPETFCSDTITEISLEAPIQQWVCAILSPGMGNIDTWNRIEEYDLDCQFDNLMQLYFGDT
jgi:glycosyltransferase involved in cell wall biosynthesis